MHHTVRREDCFYKIEKKHGMTDDSLSTNMPKCLNPHIRNPHRIYPGQKVRVH